MIVEYVTINLKILCKNFLNSNLKYLVEIK